MMRKFCYYCPSYEDAKQEAYVALLMAYKSFNHPTMPFPKYFFMVAKNKFVSIRRQFFVRQKLKRVDYTLETIPATSCTLKNYESLEQLNKFPENERKMIFARFYEKKTFTEIGQEYGVSKEWARRLINRKLKQLV